MTKTTVDLRKATLQAASCQIGRKLRKQDEGQVVGRELLELMKERDRQKEEKCRLEQDCGPRRQNQRNEYRSQEKELEKAS